MLLYLYLGLSFLAAFLLSHTPIQVPLFFLGAFLALLLAHVLVLAVAAWYFGTLAMGKANPDFAEMVEAVPFIKYLFIPFF